MKKNILTAIVASIVLVGCANDEEVAEFNKPAIYWYDKISKSISRDQLDKADTYYISLKSEHMRSPLMPTAIMLLSHAHANSDEYLLANYYLDEYNKRFGSHQSKEYIEFLKLKSSFMGVKDVYKDQKLIIDNISNANTYLRRYPNSSYSQLINSMLARLQMSQYLLNENIAALYDRTGKKRAAKIYRSKNQNSLLNMSDITPPQKGIIGKIFD